MRFLRRLRLGNPAPESQLSSAERLRAEMSAIAREIAESTQAVADLETGARATEALAMQAIHSSHDDQAKAHLMELQAQVEKIDALRADLTVLRELLDTCHAFLKQQSAETSPEVNT